MTFDQYAELHREIHGLDENTCAICLGQRKPGGPRLDREHAHFDGGYPRGLAHNRCNRILGEVERGEDAERRLELMLAYERRTKAFYAAFGVPA